MRPKKETHCYDGFTGEVVAALKELTAAEEARIVVLVQKAAS